jgi:LCP family protein required for cell wall assembly
MLKKVIIAVAIVLVFALGAGGFEAYRVYRNVMNIGSIHLRPLKACPTVTAYQPELLPWADPRRSSQVSATTPTPTPTPSRPAETKAQPCDPAGGNGKLPTLTGKSRINILVLGSDTGRKHISLLSQTVMVVTIDPVHKKVGFFSIPRDSWVAIPGSIPGDIYTYHKMDEAMSYGVQACYSCSTVAQFKNGVAYEEDAVYQNFGIHIDYYAWVGLDGFIGVINTLHGVCINAVHPMLDDLYPNDLHGGNAFGSQRVYIPAGPQCMDGSTALQYVRTRHSDQIGDFGRGQRDEQMLIALRRKLAPLGLTDFMTINSLIDDVQGYVKSDLGSQLLAMADFARQIQPGSISKVLLTPPKYSYEGSIDTPNGMVDVVYLNWPAVQSVVRKMFAPIGSHPKRYHRQQPAVTRAEAMRTLLRVSGATPAPKSATQIQKVTQPVQGTIYYVANGNVWSLSANGTKQITHTTAVDAAYVTPNGHKLVYYRRWSQNNADVWLRDLVTGKAKQITQSHATDGVVGDNAWFLNPVISPDGKTIIYSSDAYKSGSATVFQNPDCQTAPEVGGIDLALYAYDVATGTPTQLTAPCEGAGGDADPRFDPAHPNRLVYTEFHYLANSSIASRLVLLNLNTGIRTPITPYSDRNMQAAWQPNGQRMAWLGSSDQSTTLYEAPFSRGSLHKKLRRIVDSGMISEPEFSPDGRHLIYFKLIGNAFQVFEVNLKNGWPVGQPMQLLTQSGVTASAPLVWIR